MTRVSLRALVETLARERWAAVDRLRVRIEVSQEQPARIFLLPTAGEWLEIVHSCLGAPLPCPECEAFAAISSHRSVAVGPRSAPTHAHDGDPLLALAAFVTAFHLRPRRVVETGVARGVTTAAILAALARLGGGHLWSVDLPPLSREWAGRVAEAVPFGLRDRWTYLRGTSRRHLPGLISELGELDMFVHDSLHTEANIRMELGLAWRALRPGGVVIADDIQSSPAFVDLSRDASPLRSVGIENRMLVVGEPSKPGAAFGLLVKPAVDWYGAENRAG